MSTQIEKALELVNAFDTGDADKAASLLNENYIQHNLAYGIGCEAFVDPSIPAGISLECDIAELMPQVLGQNGQSPMATGASQVWQKLQKMSRRGYGTTGVA